MEILIKLIYTFLGLIATGTLLTFILFKFDFKKIHELHLDIKILMWFPLALVFLLAVELGFWFRICFFILVIIFAFIEYSSVRKNKQHEAAIKNLFVIAYLPLFLLAFAHLSLLRLLSDFPVNLVYVVIGTAVSDVGGFFFGNAFGYHKLPEVINKKKSWEGVLGQLAGALIGTLIVKQYLFQVGSLLIFIPIGIGSVVGDLYNSTVKRRLGIKQWSDYIPGHGGFLDRFCSLAGSSLFVFYYLLL